MRKTTPTYLLASSVALLTFVLYLPALKDGFVDWDDNSYVPRNSHMRSLDANFFKWAFLRFYSYNWHPLTWISHALDYLLWGLNPFGHHLSNVLLHAINTALVVVLASRLLSIAKHHIPPWLINTPSQLTKQS